MDASDAFSLRRGLSNGMLAIRVALGPMWLGGLLLSISDGCGGGSGGDLSGLLDGFEEDSAFFGRHGAARAAFAAPPWNIPEHLSVFVVGAAIAFVLVLVAMTLLMFALSCWATTGALRMNLGVLEHENDTLGPLFSGRDRFWSMASYKTLAALTLSAAFFAAVWPGALVALYGYLHDQRTLLIGGVGLSVILVVPALIYVGLGVYLGEHAVVFEGLGGVHALRRSWQLASGHRFTLLLFSLGCVVVQIASYAGLLLCCVGALATVPLGRALIGFAKTEGYLLLTRGREESARWKLWHRQLAEDRGGPPLPPPAGGPPPTGEGPGPDAEPPAR